MRSLRYLLPISVPILLAGSVEAQNLLTNGSFESPDVATGTVGVFTNPGDVPGWIEDTGGFDPCGIEIQDNCCGTPLFGDQHLEPDSNCPSRVTQSVTTQPGAKYVLTLYYSPHPGSSLGNPFDSGVDVTWNGAVIDTLIGLAVGDTDWTPHTYSVTATGTSSTVEFSEAAGANPTDQAGGFIDNVPEPGRRAQLLAGLSLLAGLARVHRRGRSR